MWKVLAVAILLMWAVQKLWKMRRQIALARQLKTGLKTYRFIGRMLFGTNEVRMKAFQDFGRDAIENGGISVCFCFNQLLLCVADPTVAEVVLNQCLEKHDFIKILDFLYGNASLIAPVHIWRPRRKINVPLFNARNLVRFFENFAKQSIVMADLLEKEVDKGIFSFWKYTTTYNLNTVNDTVLGVNTLDEVTKQPIKIALKDLCEFGTTVLCQPWLRYILPLLPWYGAACRQRGIVFDFITKSIQEKRKIINNESKQTKVSEDKRQMCSFLDHQLDAKNTLKFTDQELFEESLLLVVGGYDTLSITSAFVVLNLSRHPDIQQKAYEELQNVFGDSNRAVIYEDLSRLKYLEAVIKETLRLYPPAPLILRHVDKDVQLPSGITIVEGCGIIMNIWAVHRNAQYWGPDADQFRPERFLDFTPAHPAAFMPFGYGLRNCIGYRYALISLKTMLCTILRRYRVLAPPGVPQGEPLRTKFDVMLSHAGDYEIRLERRN